jgi:hypothetical protein
MFVGSAAASHGCARLDAGVVSANGAAACDPDDQLALLNNATDLAPTYRPAMLIGAAVLLVGAGIAASRYPQGDHEADAHPAPLCCYRPAAVKHVNDLATGGSDQLAVHVRHHDASHVRSDTLARDVVEAAVHAGEDPAFPSLVGDLLERLEVPDGPW